MTIRTHDSPPRTYRSFLVAGLFVIHLLMTILALRSFMEPPSDYLWPRWQCIFLESLAVSQIGLVTTFLTVGKAPFLQKLLGGIAVFAFWLATLNFVGLLHEYWLLLVLIHASGIYVGLVAALRISNMRLTCLDGTYSESNRQFNLRQMFVWMTAAACGLGVVSLALQDPSFAQIRHEELPRALVLGVLFVLVTLVLTYVILGAKRRIAPWLIAIIVVGGSAMAAGVADQYFRNQWWTSLNGDVYAAAYRYWVLLTGVITLVSLITIRGCGYRFTKPNPDQLANQSETANNN